MIRFFKRSVRRLFHSAGYDITLFDPISNPTLQVSRALQKFEVDLVVDVGANAGQFARELRSLGYRGRIVSFEPLAEAHRLLESEASDDPLWQVYRRCAIGDRDEEVEINVSANSWSSSLLPMNELNVGAEPKTVYIGKEKVPLQRLDSIVNTLGSDSKMPFLKIDTQGFEWQVMDGAQKLLQQVKGVHCELSLVELYVGQRLWKEVIKRLEDLGFTLWALYPVFIDPRDGRTLQVDGTFFRL